MFGRYRYTQLSFGAAPAPDKFQKKIDELVSHMPIVFSIADDILIVDFDEKSKDHDATLDKVLMGCRWGNLRLKKDKCLLRCTSFPFFGEISPSKV